MADETTRRRRLPREHGYRHRDEAGPFEGPRPPPAGATAARTRGLLGMGGRVPADDPRSEPPEAPPEGALDVDALPGRRRGGEAPRGKEGPRGAEASREPPR